MSVSFYFNVDVLLSLPFKVDFVGAEPWCMCHSILMLMFFSDWTTTFSQASASVMMAVR